MGVAVPTKREQFGDDVSPASIGFGIHTVSLAASKAGMALTFPEL